MKKISIFCLLLAAGLFSGACAKITYDATTLSGFAAMTTPENLPDYEIVGRMKHSTRAVFIAASLLTVKDSQLENAVEKAMAKYDGDAVINVKIEEVTDFTDFLIGAASNSILNTRHVEVTGDVIKLKPGSTSQVPSFNEQLRAAVEDNLSLSSN